MPKSYVYPLAIKHGNGKYPLVIQHFAIEHGRLWLMYLSKMVIFHNYVCLPEGTLFIDDFA